MSRGIRFVSKSKRRLTLAGALVIALAGVFGALGYWSTHGTGSASASLGTLTPATIAAPSTSNALVTITWVDEAAMVPASQSSSITYVVERKTTGSYSPISSGPCSGSLTYPAHSCNDTTVSSDGTYTYEVVAHYNSWSATSNEVSVGVDATPPTVTSINRADASPTNAASVHWTVTFSEPVSGVDASDFSFTTTGAVTGASLTSVTGGPTTYTVTATSGSGDGTLRLDVADDDTINDSAGNKLGGTGTSGPGNGSFTTGQAYTIDKTAPSVSSINRTDANPTQAATVRWTVALSESVSGVDATDFTLTRGGSLTGGAIQSVTPVDGSHYTVAATTGSGDGTLRLDLADDDSIVDGVGNKLGGTGIGNGSFTGQPYTIDRTSPAVTVDQAAAQADPTSALPIHFTAVFNEPVNALAVNGSGVLLGGTANHSAATVAVSQTDSSHYDIAVSGLTSNGTLTAALTAAATTDLAGNASAASTSTDNSVSFDTTAPTVTLTQVNGAAAAFPLATNATVSSIGGACETAAGNSAVTWSVTGDATESGTTNCTAGAWTQTLTTALSAEGHYTLAASQTDAAGNPGSTGNKSVTVDKTKPQIAATALANGNPYTANTWTNQNVTVSFTCADTGSVQTGLAVNTVGGGGTQSAETSSGSFTNTGTCTDNAGNTALANTFAPIKIDKTKPLIAATALSNGNPYTANTWTNHSVTVTFGCADTGSFQSGLNVNTIGGGGTQSAETSTGSFTSTGTCTDTAGNTADPNTFSPIKVDLTAPSGGNVDANSLVGTGGRYANTLALQIAFAKGSDTGGSGLAPTGATLWRAQGTLASSDGLVDGTCTAFGAFAQVGATDPASPFATTAPADNACYRYQYRVLDVAGNLATYTSGDIKVETAAPTSLAPTLTYSAVSGNVYVDTSSSPDTVYFIDATSRSGSFTVTAASASDAFSGVTGYTFPTTLTGWTITGTGDTRTFSYSGSSATPPATVNFGATDNATKTGTTVLGFANDSNLPIVAITSLANNATITDNTPSFSGDCINYTGDAVTVKVSQGATVVATVTDTDCSTGGQNFTTGSTGTLPDGTYTAQASQTRGGHVGISPVITFTIDTTRPSVTINQAAGQSDPSNASSINFTATFSEPVTGFTSSDVTKSSGTVTVTGGPTIYNVAVAGMTNGSALIVSIAQNVATDTVGNQNTASTSTDNSVTYDATAPVVTLTKVNGVTATFPDFTSAASVTSFGGACGVVTRDNPTVDWSVTGGSTQTGSVACSAGAWSVTLPTALSTEATYTLSATQTDTASNTGTTGNQTLTIDRTGPTVTINQAAGQADPSAVSPINFTVVFSEATTDFATGDVTLTGTSGGTKVGTVTGSGTTYNVAVTGMTGGTVIASLAAGVAHDATGNASAASTSTDNSVTFTPPPTVTSITLVGGSPTRSTSVQWTVTFSTSVTGVDSSDFALAATGLTGTPAVTGVTGSAATYTVTASTGTGTTGATNTLGLNLVDNDSIVDGSSVKLGGTGAGNGNFTGQAYTIDKTAPTLSSITADNGDGTTGFIGSGTNTPDTLTFTYTDANGVSPGSIVSGWDGTGSKNVSVTFTTGSPDSITVPGLGTVTLGSSNYVAQTQTVTESLSMSATNVFVLTITTTPSNGGSGQSSANFTWSASGGTAADVAGNAATGSVTTNTQRF